MTTGIYKLTIDGHFYYGQSDDIDRRFSEHQRDLRKGIHTNAYIQSAYNKYGNLKGETVLICASEHLDLYEQIFLNLYHGTQGCMNIARDAKAPSRGLPKSAEHKARISASNKGTKPAECTIEAVIASNKRRKGKKLGPQSKEHIAALSAVRKNRPKTEDWKMKHSLAMKAYWADKYRGNI